MKLPAMLLGAAALALPLAVLGVPDRVRIPMAKPHPTGAPQVSAVFSHWGHAQYRCFTCHPSVFPQALAGFTHADMNEGRFCARCHGAKVARPVFEYKCEACHVAR
jgi:c(7)-type cytochrome triheme protein